MNSSHPPIERLIDYVHGELPPRDDVAVHAHLADCSTCTQTYGAEVRLGEMLRANALEAERELPPGLATAILARARSEDWQTWQTRLARYWRPLVAVPIAAAIALLIYVGMPGRVANQHAGGNDASYYMENHAALAARMPLGTNDAIPVMLTSEDSTR